jgi:hypothetical protein
MARQRSTPHHDFVKLLPFRLADVIPGVDDADDHNTASPRVVLIAPPEE